MPRYKTRYVPCPICSSSRMFSARYPNALCNSCGYSKDLVDSNGNPVEFSNVCISGGFVSLHRENGVIVKRDEHTCFLNGIECYAEEARFGGIAVQILVPCPACQGPHVAKAERHLGGLCQECVYQLVDSNGNDVRFDYEDRWEHTGFVSLHDENDECVKKNEHVCFLNGKQCYADNIDDTIIVRLDS
jgi:hypothetical protein